MPVVRVNYIGKPTETLAQFPGDGQHQLTK